MLTGRWKTWNARPVGKEVWCFSFGTVGAAAEPAPWTKWEIVWTGIWVVADPAEVGNVRVRWRDLTWWTARGQIYDSTSADGRESMASYLETNADGQRIEKHADEARGREEKRDPIWSISSGWFLMHISHFQTLRSL